MSDSAAEIRRLGLDPSFAAEGFRQLAENAICSICHDYLEDIAETDCEARHVFCRPCLKSVYDLRQPCPECRGRMSKMEKAHIRLCISIEAVQWKCLNFEKGCKFTGTKKELVKHLDEVCEEQQTECPIEGCDYKNLRRNLAEHERVCPFRIVPCEHCKEGVAFNAMQTHLSVCKGFPLPCPNGCGKSPPRGDIRLHKETECAEQTVRCTVPGCAAEVKRKELETHNDDNMKKHTKLLTDRVLALEKTLKNAAERDELHLRVYLPRFEAKASRAAKRTAVKSAHFFFQGSRFCVSVYPKGDSKSADGKASLYLTKLDDYKGKLSYELEAATKKMSADYDFSTVNVNRGRGRSSFSSTEDLLSAARNAEDGALEVRVTLSAASSKCTPCVIRGYAPGG
uniref:RING-type domain-containing protein n=1 Tax=Chromera velia CCMP2878 TaxID=1169474 RepID=A0A0G4FWP3_9ALVE|eukprot:Cvel_19013.t1-p1 / transcript=Cvel_19013.t1 / gene=Cvel_19013 / organism=Chromera_velia_CCMP2878 / gene_product=TNF receptor-associated factor family protein, putative / transcript_product=TNF receptor-associated factor family protein, putative / location=Cvel_scaffold1609:26530-28101(-) / protein_length=396 / sequence_SO=supercontig / SO=protein_coding / is_pseudo=false